MAQQYDYGMWAVAAFNIGLLLFLIVSFLAPTGWKKW